MTERTQKTITTGFGFTSSIKFFIYSITTVRYIRFLLVDKLSLTAFALPKEAANGNEVFNQEMGEVSVKQLHKFGLVMGVNFETIAAMVVAYYAAEYLNEKYPKDFNWSSVTYVLALLLIIRSWYVMLRVLIRDQKTGGASASPSTSESKNEDRPR